MSLATVASSVIQRASSTLPQAQGRQIATRLLQFADKYLQEQGIEAAVLYPAEPSLYRFYEKRGYEVWFSRSILSFPPLMQKGTDWELQPLSAGQYHREQLRLLPQAAARPEPHAPRPRPPAPPAH